MGKRDGPAILIEIESQPGSPSSATTTAEKFPFFQQKRKTSQMSFCIEGKKELCDAL
jgi:hypothetical protein